MTKLNRNSFQFCTVIFAITALLTACSSNSTTGSATSGGASLSASSALTLNPPSITLRESGVMPFTASGGSGSYTYSTDTSEGASIGSTSGYYLAPGSWTGTTTVIVTDSSGATAVATVYVTATSSVIPVTATASVTGTLNNCVGVSGGYTASNNWEVNGSELRSINDLDYTNESPINCTGFSAAGSIPANATIVGLKIEMFLINQSDTYDNSYLESTNLINAGATVGTASALNQLIPGNSGTFPTHTEGGSGNNWGGTLTPSIVNSSTFGFSIQTFRTENRLFLGEAAGVVPQMTIYYEL